MRPYRACSWSDLWRLLEARQPRDEQAWRELEQRLQAYTRAVLSPKQKLDPTLADEVVNQVLAKLHGSPNLVGKLDASFTDPKPYLLSMLYHALVDCLRSRGIRMTGVADWPVIDTRHPNPAQEAERRDSALELRAILRRALGEEEWSLVELRFWKELSIAEIAEIMGAPYHAAAMRIHRLQHKMREIVEKSSRER